LTRGRVVAAGVLLALLISACGKKVIIPAPTEKVVSRFVHQRTGIQPTNVHCPADVPAKVGGTFQCHFTAPDGKYTANMRIASVHGARVTYGIQTYRNGQTISAAAADRLVSDFVFAHTKFRPRDVSCPASTPVIPGGSFQCRFTGPDGRYVSTVQIRGISGSNLSYHVTTRRSS
jgi:hypothetical protein